MSVGREIKRRVKAVAPSVFLLAVAVYFSWNATQGNRGLQAYARQQDQLRLAQSELAHVNAEVEVWDRRVSALRSSRLDPDVLDERARAILNVAEPDETIVLYGQGKKLF